MHKNEKAALVAIGWPVPELLPGFLVPIFEIENLRYVQSADKYEIVGVFHPLSGSGIQYSLQILTETFRRQLVLLSREVTSGDYAVHAFDDRKNIFVGTKVALVPLLQDRLPDIVDNLKSYPNCLAGLYEFIGDIATARKLRRTQSADFLIDKIYANEARPNILEKEADRDKSSRDQSARRVDRTKPLNVFEKEIKEFVSRRDRSSYHYRSAAQKVLNEQPQPK